MTDDQHLLVDELNNYLIPLESPPLDLTDSDLNYLHRLKDAKVVGLGEATHGTRDFFQMKHRIFRYLVEKSQHKVIGFEADLKSWLVFRAGAQKVIGDIASEQKIVDNTVKSESGNSPFGFSVGLGIEYKKLVFDFMLDRDFIKRGPYILSGASGSMFPRATATYQF